MIGRVGLSHLIENSYKEKSKVSIVAYKQQALLFIFHVSAKYTCNTELSFPIASSVKSPVTVSVWKEVKKKKASELPQWMATALSHS